MVIGENIINIAICFYVFNGILGSGFKNQIKLYTNLQERINVLEQSRKVLEAYYGYLFWLILKLTTMSL